MLERLRNEIKPATAADFVRFLFRWQPVVLDANADSRESFTSVLVQLDGYELGAGAWESDMLPARLPDYDPLWLDGLCLSGETAWGRLTAAPSAEGGTRSKSGPIR